MSGRDDKPTVMAVDIGNSSLHARSSRGESATFRTLQSSGDVASEASDWISTRSPAQVRVASVCRPVESALIAALEAPAASNATSTAASNDTNGGAQTTIRCITHRDVPIEVRVDEPEKVGIDRLIAAWAAAETGATPVAVMDSGSAITLDLVDDDGVFRGGVIVPGLAMQTTALAGATDRLFEIEFASHEISLPATNTADAIHAGILLTVVAGIDRIVDRYRGQVRGPLRIVGTGGDVAWLVPLLEMEIDLKPDLVCDGILALPLDG